MPNFKGEYVMVRNHDQKKLNLLDVIGAVVAALALFCVTFVIVRASGVYLALASLAFIYVAFQLLEFIQNIIAFVRRGKIKKNSYDNVVVAAKSKFNI